MLDMLSATVYLLTLKTDCFKAVLKAHKEYSRLKTTISSAQIQSYLEEYGTAGEVTGIYRKWIVLQSVLNGAKVFGTVRAEDILNF